MRAFSFALTLAVAISVNAAIIKRTVSPPVQLCITDMKSVFSQATEIASDFRTNLGLSEDRRIPLPPKMSELENRLKLAGMDCCAIPKTMSAEEVKAVLDTVGSYYDNSTDTLKELVARKSSSSSSSSSFALLELLLQLDPQTMISLVKGLHTCLIEKTPTDPLNY